MPQQIVGGPGGNIAKVNSDGSLDVTVVSGGGGGGGTGSNTAAPGTVTKTMNDHFTHAAGIDPALWDVTIVGDVTYQQMAGVGLAIDMPATVGASITMLSKQTFTGYVDFSFLSNFPAISNRSAVVEFVSVDVNGLPTDEWNFGFAFDPAESTTLVCEWYSQPGGAATSTPLFGSLWAGVTHRWEYAGGDLLWEVYPSNGNWSGNIARPITKDNRSQPKPPGNTSYKIRLSIVNSSSIAPATANEHLLMRIEANEFVQPQTDLHSLPVRVLQGWSNFGDPWPMYIADYNTGQNYLYVLPDGSLPVQAAKAATATSTIITVDAVQTVAPDNGSRKRVRIENLSGVPLFLKLGSGASPSDFSVTLKACTAANDGTGGVFVEDAYTGEITGVAASGSGNTVAVVEI